jgi:ankyrin repeat protein
MSILNLPNELLLSIAECLPSKKCKSQFAQSNRRIYLATINHLYRFDSLDDEPSGLIWAAEEGVRTVVERYLTHNRDLTLCKKTVQRALISAVEHGHEQIVTVLINHGADPNGGELPDKTGYPLHQAARYGRIQVVKALLDYGVDREQLDRSGKSATFYAAENGHLEVLRFLTIADVEHKCGCGKSMLHKAAYAGHYEVVKFLVERGADVRATARNGGTPLHLAASEGCGDVVRFLVERGAELTVTSNDGSTPLHSAARWNHEEVVRFLVDKGADLEATKINQRTPLHLAVRHRHPNLAKTLVELGADLTAIDSHEQTPLHMAASNAPYDLVMFLLERFANRTGKVAPDQAMPSKAVQSRHLEFMKNLLELNTASPEAEENSLEFPKEVAEYGHDDLVLLLREKIIGLMAKGRKPKNAVERAISLGHLHSVKIMLKHNDTLLEPKGTFSDLLEEAIAEDQRDIAEYLVERGADITATDGEGWTMLHVAAWKAKISYTEWLISLGADINRQTSECQTCLALAIVRGEESMAQILLQHGADPSLVDSSNQSPLNLASYSGFQDTVRLLLMKGADQTAHDINGASPLFMAAQNGHLEVVKMLLGDGLRFDDGSTLSAGQRANIDALRNNGFNPLMVASTKGDMEIVNLLPKHGASPTAEDKYGDTSLDFAIHSDRIDVVKALLHAGEDVSAHPSGGWRRLFLAAIFCQYEMVKLLLDKGAKVNVRCDPTNFAWIENDEPSIDLSVRTSAIAAAASKGKADVVKLLLENGADINGETEGYQGEPPLCIAASVNSIETVRLLVEYGASVEQISTISKKTSLQIAVACGYREVADLLLQQGADATMISCPITR